MYKYHQQMKLAISQLSLANQSRSNLLRFNRSPVKPLILQNPASRSPLNFTRFGSIISHSFSKATTTTHIRWPTHCRCFKRLLHLRPKHSLPPTEEAVQASKTIWFVRENTFLITITIKHSGPWAASFILFKVKELQLWTFHPDYFPNMAQLQATASRTPNIRSGLTTNRTIMTNLMDHKKHKRIRIQKSNHKAEN